MSVSTVSELYELKTSGERIKIKNVVLSKESCCSCSVCMSKVPLLNIYVINRPTGSRQPDS